MYSIRECRGLICSALVAFIVLVCITSTSAALAKISVLQETRSGQLEFCVAYNALSPASIPSRAQHIPYTLATINPPMGCSSLADTTIILPANSKNLPNDKMRTSKGKGQDRQNDHDNPLALMIDRGVCNFSHKIQLARDLGASAVIILNFAPEIFELPTTSGNNTSQDIIAVFAGNETGASLKHLIDQNGETKIKIFAPERMSKWDPNTIFVLVFSVLLVCASSYLALGTLRDKVGKYDDSSMCRLTKRKQKGSQTSEEDLEDAHLSLEEDGEEEDDEDESDEMDEEDTGDEIFFLTPAFSVFFVLCASTMLVVLFFFYKYLVMLIMVLFCFAASSAQYNAFSRFWDFMSTNVPVKPKPNRDSCFISRAFFYIWKYAVSLVINPLRRLPTINVPFYGGIRLISILLFFMSLPTPIIWFFERHADYIWPVQDFLGIFIILSIVHTTRLPSLKVATLLLVLFFLYDIFFVFITPFMTSNGESIMVSVATGGGSNGGVSQPGPGSIPSPNATPSEVLPLAFVIPHLFRDAFAVCETGLKFSLLGFGDIAIPSLLTAFGLSFDYKNMLKQKRDERLAKKASNKHISDNNDDESDFANLTNQKNQKNQSSCAIISLIKKYPYFISGCIGYALGLSLTEVSLYVTRMAQPALLYLVPTTLGCIYFVGWRKQQVQLLWSGYKYESHKVLSKPEADPENPQDQLRDDDELNYVDVDVACDPQDGYELDVFVQDGKMMDAQ
eukprot:TRINITY_DN12434_c0_g1_i1.p1 TRINITY_DN12434_c0_g1~~TRINITY_DN12434_c0_g1_i1.p1  ORF type:complete len:733 (-),score=211.11 TRINITY_DN12434_c0_g1_i1:97-2295(-)